MTTVEAAKDMMECGREGRRRAVGLGRGCCKMGILGHNTKLVMHNSSLEQGLGFTVLLMQATFVDEIALLSSFEIIALRPEF